MSLRSVEVPFQAVSVMVWLPAVTPLVIKVWGTKAAWVATLTKTRLVLMSLLSKLTVIPMMTPVVVLVEPEPSVVMINRLPWVVKVKVAGPRGPMATKFVMVAVWKLADWSVPIKLVVLRLVRLWPLPAKMELVMKALVIKMPGTTLVANDAVDALPARLPVKLPDKVALVSVLVMTFEGSEVRPLPSPLKVPDKVTPDSLLVTRLEGRAVEEMEVRPLPLPVKVPVNVTPFWPLVTKFPGIVDTVLLAER